MTIEYASKTARITLVHTTNPLKLIPSRLAPDVAKEVSKQIQIQNVYQSLYTLQSWTAGL